MNAEKLHLITRAIRDDLNETNVQPTLQALVNALQQYVNQPAQPGPQQQVSQKLEALYDVLSKSSSNNFSPSWRQLIKELEVEYLLGDNLAKGLRGIFERNQITPSVALQEVKGISDKLTKLKQSMDKLIESFEALKIGKEELEPGECEVGIVIPLSAINERFTNFTKELIVIDGIYGVFAEITTGERPGFKIRSLSSSDPSVYIYMAVYIAAALALAVNQIINSYKQILEIKKLRMGMRDQGVPLKNLSGVTRYANSLMGEAINAVSKKVFKKYYKEKDKNRTPELDTELHYALNKLATRIDKGFNIEVRVEPVPEHGDEKTPSKPDQNVRDIEYIRSTYETLKFIKTDDEPILSLPESKIKRKEKPKKQ